MSAHHGNTPAAWTAVLIVLLGFLVAGLGLVLGSMLMFWIGVALGPIGGIVGLVMSKMGMGADTGAETAAAKAAYEKRTATAEH